MIARGVARYTADIDATVSGGASDLPALVKCFRGHGFVTRIAGALKFASEHQVLLLRHEDSRVDLDLSLAWLTFEEEAIAAAESVDYAGVNVRVVRAEDLIIYKLIAHRPRDLDDAERLLLLHRSRIDLGRVRDVLGMLAEALEGPDRLATLHQIDRRANAAERPIGRRKGRPRGR